MSEPTTVAGKRVQRLFFGYWTKDHGPKRIDESTIATIEVEAAAPYIAALREIVVLAEQATDAATAREALRIARTALEPS